MKTLVRKLKHRYGARPIGLCLLLCFCAMAVPLPMAVPPKPVDGEKDRSQPFPCQDRPCGCSSAEQCWKKCCCFTNVQKVAWAKANNVAIPEYVVKAAAAEQGEQLASATQGEVCCQTPKASADEGSSSSGEETGKPKRACCSSASRSCCQDAKKSCSSCDKKCDESKDDAPRRTRLFTGLNAAECQGLSFLMAIISLPFVDNSSGIAGADPNVSECCEVFSERLPAGSVRPPVPPPKIDAAA